MFTFALTGVAILVVVLKRTPFWYQSKEILEPGDPEVVLVKLTVLIPLPQKKD